MKWCSVIWLVLWSTVSLAVHNQSVLPDCQWVDQTDTVKLTFVPGEIKGLCSRQALDRGFYQQPEDWLIAMYAGSRVPDNLRRQRVKTYVAIAPATLFPAPADLIIHYKNGRTSRVSLAPRKGRSRTRAPGRHDTAARQTPEITGR